MKSGKDVVALRHQFGLSKTRLAEELEVCRATVRRLEKTEELTRRDQLMLRGLRVELLERKLKALEV